MKTTLKILNCIILTLLLFTFSCSSDDNGGGSSGINVQNLVTNFDENPTVGASVGMVQASSGNTLSFSITMQTPSGALSINTSTGELKVANASLFDYETNPVINASISIIDPSDTASVTATINLNNLDDIAFFLSTSEALYTAAADGDWVEITGVEYTSLADNLNDISRAGLTDSQYNSAVSSTTFVGPYSRSNYTTTAMIPNGGYVIAFKYKAVSAINEVDFKVKLSSTANNAGFTDLGSALPLHSGSNEDLFFVLKGNSTSVPADGYLGLYQPSTSTMNSIVDANNNGHYWENGDQSSFSNQYVSRLMFYQGLITTQVQW